MRFVFQSMRYLQTFYFASGGAEDEFFFRQKLRCYDSYYPFGFLPKKGIGQLSFSDVTILYGGNGSGKTTLLNVMAEKLGAQRMAAYNRSNFFEEYLSFCEAEMAGTPDVIQIITSDDVFDYMLDLRHLNQGIDSKREARFEDFLKYQKKPKHFSSIDDLEEVRASLLANSKTMSQFVRRTLPDNVREYSNGESGYRYFANNIKDNGLYFLDEPENSLAPGRQQDLAQLLFESARFFGCQLVIATHSPFLLAIPGAKVYDMDAKPVIACDWHRLEGVQTYHAFFETHREALIRAAQEKEREEAEREAAKARREEGPELSPARARLAAQLRERHLAEKDVTALLGLMQKDAQATALANTVMHWNPDRFRTEKGQKEFRASVFEEAMRIWQEDEED